jgi:hypothetical protein
MTHQPVLIASLLLVSFLSACKKDDVDTQPPTAYADYSNLKVGNYWVYQTYEVDENGVETSTNYSDSCYVEKDSTINGLVYHKVIRPAAVLNQIGISFLRDSLHYVVSSNGTRLFSSQDFDNVLYTYVLTNNADTLYTAPYRMTDKDSIINTAAGSFTTFNYQGIFHYYPALGGAIQDRPKQTRYAKDIGIVEENIGFYVSSPKHYVRRLVAFHVE